MNDLIPGTVCCLLCRGMVIYKDGDKSRFKNHMNNEHGAFFDIDYLLASCLLEMDQKEAVAKTVKTAEYTNLMLGENMPTEAEVTLREETMYNIEDGGRVDPMVVKKETYEYSLPPLDADLKCGSCEVQFGTQEAFQQHFRKGCKKGETKKKNGCEQCGKQYTSKQSLRAHTEKMHNSSSDAGIKQERYDDPSMDPNQMYTRYPEENEMTNNEEPSYEANNYEVNTNSTEPYQPSPYEPPTKEVNDYSSREEDLDQILNEVRKRNEDVLQESADESFANEEVGSEASGGRFACQVENCGKSYTAKTNRQSHEKKVHNIISARSKTKRLKSTTEETQEEAGNDGQEKESNVKWDELEKIRAQYYNTTAVMTNEKIDDDFNIEGVDDGYKPKQDEPSSPSFLSDTSMDFNEAPSEDQATNQPNESSTDKLDTSQSKYFTKNPKVITSARGKSISLFNEIPFGLSENWKMRTFEATTKLGAKSMIKHYLSPELKVLKTGLAVVEYLRLKGEMGPEQILDISKVLNVSEGKLKSLYE